MHNLIILEEAEREFQEAALWYDKKSRGLGIRFAEVIRKNRVNSGSSEKYEKKRFSFREAVVKVFPFVIIHIFYKKEGLIMVTAIFHTSRNPKKKFRRK